MIKRLIVESYMAHRHTVLELAPGVTVITGPNNSGKSALVEAVRSIAQNPSTRHAIRHGAKKAVVRVELDAGEAIEWIRGEGGTVYSVTRSASSDTGGEKPAADTETYAKFGRKPPEDVRGLLRLDPVQTETGPVDIHIGNQRYPIFLLDQAGSQAASFFAASTEAEHLLRVQQRLKEKSDFAARRRRELLRRCAEQEKDLKRFDGLETVEGRLVRAETLFEGIGRSLHALPLLAACLEGLEKARERLQRTSARTHVLMTLTEPPVAFETPAVEVWLEEEAVLRHRVLNHAARARVLSATTAPPSPTETRDLEEVTRHLETTTVAMVRAEESAVALAALQSVPELQETVVLEHLTQEIRRAGAVREKLRVAGGLLSRLEPPSDVTDGTPLRDLAAALEACVSRLGHSHRREGLLITLEEPPSRRDTPIPEEFIRSIETLQTRLGRLAGRGACLENLPMPPEPLPSSELENTLREAVRLEKALEHCASRQEKQTRELRTRRETLQQILKDVDACPFCGHSMDLEHFLEETHGGERHGG